MAINDVSTLVAGIRRSDWPPSGLKVTASLLLSSCTTILIVFIANYCCWLSSHWIVLDYAWIDLE